MRRALPLLVAGCVAPVGSSDQPIVGGTTDTADASVVGIIVTPQTGSQNDVFCSGTVVSPHVVLTAAHCLDPDVVGAPVASVLVFLGTNFLDPSQSSEVATVSTWEYDTSFQPESVTAGHDLGVVVTADALSLAPVALNHDGLGSGDVGSPVHAVGFGQTDGNSPTTAGPRRSIDTTIFGVDDAHVVLDDVICEGDSGGPTFETRSGKSVLIGVHSFTTSMSCMSTGDDTRVDVDVSSFIDPAIDKADPGFLSSGGCNQAGRSGTSLAPLALLALLRRRR